MVVLDLLVGLGVVDEEENPPEAGRVAKDAALRAGGSLFGGHWGLVAVIRAPLRILEYCKGSCKDLVLTIMNFCTGRR